MKKISLVTGSRAEYGLQKPLITKLFQLHKEKSIEFQLLVTGMHLVPEFGNTIEEILSDGFSVFQKFPIHQQETTDESLKRIETKNQTQREFNSKEKTDSKEKTSLQEKSQIAAEMSRAISEFTTYFLREKPDLLILLGDRYEIFAVATAAGICHIPIAHLHGGETTEGAEDEFFRHGITKMSQLHFPSCQVYRKRIIQLGEDPKRVFHVGALGVENIKNMNYLSRKALEESLSIDLQGDLILLTFHPVTMEDSTEEEQVAALLDAIDELEQSGEKRTFLFTKANADAGGRKINEILEKYCQGKENKHLFSSLGVLRYLSLMKLSKAVVGNSSSGIIEAPAMKVPTVNIGDRQKGRIQSGSILNCSPQKDEIVKTVSEALSLEFYEKVQNQSSLFGEGNTSELILDIIMDFLQKGKIDLKKKFYDIEFEVEE